MHICNNNIVRRVSHHQIICLEGLNIVQLLSGGYPTSKLSVLRVWILYNYCPEGIPPANYLSCMRVWISYNYCPEGIPPAIYLSWGSKYQNGRWKGHVKLDYCLASPHIKRIEEMMICLEGIFSQIY